MSAIIGYVFLDPDGDLFGGDTGFVKPYKNMADLPPLLDDERVAELREITKCVWKIHGDDARTSCTQTVTGEPGDSYAGVNYCFNCGQRVEVSS